MVEAEAARVSGPRKEKWKSTRSLDSPALLTAKWSPPRLSLTGSQHPQIHAPEEARPERQADTDVQDMILSRIKTKI